MQQLRRVGFRWRTTGKAVDSFVTHPASANISHLALKHEDLLHTGPVQEAVECRLQFLLKNNTAQNWALGVQTGRASVLAVEKTH